MFRRILYFAISACAVGLDQFAKALARSYLKPGGGAKDIPLIKGVFSLSYVENPGMAFGFLKDARWLFISLSIAVTLVIIWAVARLNPRKTWFMLGLSFVLGGAVGNLIDRVFSGYVVDFFYFRLINFPVFNLADSFVTAGAVMLGIYFVFFERNKRIFY